MANASPLITVMMNAARIGARSLSRDFGEVENLQVSKKGPADFVTAADRMAEEKIFDSLRHDRPGYGYLMEERGIVDGSDKTHRFIIDPLDGTLNFMHGNPHFAISIGVEREGQLHGGVIYDIIRDEMFFAEAGQGAFLLDSRGVEKRLRMPDRTDFTASVIATGTPWYGKPGHAKFLKELHKVMANCAGIRRFGSAALDLAWVAAGRFDGFWERGLHPWDIAAGIVIVREARGEVQELDTGAPDPLNSGNLVCASTTLMPQLLKHLSV
ncbi:MAG TPA: inositol monophosphatase [Hellea balneolensis]|uniref:Inositol-1-monophosphatase n=1 Tax=Hellea balneolensis TaxID=287478 RepID=A0A7C3GLV5_9PROT|nr:inositol monophosphatase [Hellea balneolensis]